MLFRSTPASSPGEAKFAMRRPFSSTRVDEVPSPRRFAELKPRWSPPTLMLAPSVSPPTLAASLDISSAAVVTPILSMSSRVTTWTGNAVSDSSRLIAEPVTSTRCRLSAAPALDAASAVNRAAASVVRGKVGRAGMAMASFLSRASMAQAPANARAGRRLTCRTRCLPLTPRRRSVCLEHPQDVAAVGFELLGTHAADLCEVVEALRVLLGHLGQGHVLEDHVGGQAVFPGDFGAPRLERLEAGLGFVVELDRRGLAAGTAAAGAAARGRLAAFRRGGGHAQQQLHLALEHRARRLVQRQRVVLAFADHMAQRDQLAQHGAPLLLAQVGADGPGGERVVAVLRHLLGLLAAQHVDQMAGAEAAAAVLVEAGDAGEQIS